MHRLVIRRQDASVTTAVYDCSVPLRRTFSFELICSEGCFAIWSFPRLPPAMTQLIKSHLASSLLVAAGDSFNGYSVAGQRLVGQRPRGQRLSVVAVAVACALLRRVRLFEI
jgi:hypothetical protein